ncbi:hypothetical protein KV205_15000 [Streptomyces sp. SKN60]|uniref:RCC1 domain-containing protein n=1 Tax=Streptomyces sp. SKN60 TaxID=2855506 RepID=UPI0022465F45|nr:RCC1 domain-containing protein [Streptomyces sp. SKN60]MCX2181832.1 hypothetical protein [Streptomyces sp. SKN60]
MGGGGGAGNTANGFAVALLKDGTVKSWGNNATGQLGDGSTTGTTGTATTTALPPGSGITHVTATTTGKSGFAY